MQLRFKSKHLSIESLAASPLPPFAVLIGRNGVGKTHLLKAIQRGHVVAPECGKTERYDIDSFRPPASEVASWVGSLGASTAAQTFFHGSGPETPADLAATIYNETAESFGLSADSESRARFAAQVKRAMDAENVRALGSSGHGLSGDPRIDDAVESYTRALRLRVLSRLQLPESGKARKRDVATAGMVTLAMRLAGKLAHDLDQSDFLRAAHYEGETIANTISEAFTRYKVDQYSWAHSESEIPGRGDVATLLRTYRANNKPPWETLREILAHMREDVGDDLFNFESRSETFGSIMEI